jgi:site-specific recombinase XerD
MAQKIVKLRHSPKQKSGRHTVKHSKENALETNEEKKLFNAIKDLNAKPETRYKYEVLVHLMINSGLRVSEAIQVRLEWFKESEDGLLINIPDKDRDLLNMKRDWKPKTQAGKREVIFADKAIGEKVRSFFISNNRGLGFTRQRAYQVIKRLGQIIDKPGLHPHALRSTYANKLVYLGVNVNTLCYYMGWNNLQTAVNYVKTSNIAARRDLMDKVGEK